MTTPRNARSALNLRLVLALGGTVICLVLGGLVWQAFGVGPAVFLFVLAAISIVDLGIVQRRRHRRAVAHRDQDHTHDSLFE